MQRTPLAIVSLLIASIALAACPGRGKRQVGPPKLSIPSNGDSQARARFDASRSQFERDGEVQNSQEFEAIVRDFPNDPIVPHALLYGAMADLRAADPGAALAKVDQIKLVGSEDAMLMARASLFRGLALSSLGRAPEALPDLQSGASALNRGDRDEMGSFHASMAESLVANSQPEAAISQYDAWWSLGTLAEKSYAADRVQALVGQLPEGRVEAAYQAAKGRLGPAVAFLGTRYAQQLGASGASTSQVAEVLGLTSQAQRAIGTEILAPGASGPGDSEIVGALLPVSGRLNRIGELSMRGLIMASRRYPGAQLQASPGSAFSLVARDTSSGAEAVGAGLSSLIRSQAVAVVGPFDGSALGKAAPMASSMGLSLISLAQRGIANGALSIRHSAEERAQELARHAYGKGVRDFAIFAPQSGYGRVVGGAFRKEVEKLGGSVVVEVDYDKDTTSFKDEVRKLKKPWSAVFVPDLANKLELIAPALAAANLNAQPIGKKPKHGRGILLLSTAEGLDNQYLRSAGRYSLGAVFAPGFYPDRTDAIIGEFVSRYVSEFGAEPSAHEAYAYDAATVIRHAVDEGARTRQQVGEALRNQSVSSLTGEIRFGADGRRSDPGLLFEVHEPIASQYELRALR